MPVVPLGRNLEVTSSIGSSRPHPSAQLSSGHRGFNRHRAIAGPTVIAPSRVQPSSRHRGSNRHRVIAGSTVIGPSRVQPSSRHRGSNRHRVIGLYRHPAWVRVVIALRFGSCHDTSVRMYVCMYVCMYSSSRSVSRGAEVFSCVCP